MSTPPHQHLAETLAHVAPKVWRSTADIYTRLNKSFIGQTAVSNRLMDLFRIGCVVFERRGKEKFWRRK